MKLAGLLMAHRRRFQVGFIITLAIHTVRADTVKLTYWMGV